MILKVVNSNRVGALFLAPLIAVIAFFISFKLQLPQLEIFTEDGMPLWNYVNRLLEGSTTLTIALGFTIAFVIGLIINRMTNKYLLFRKPTFLPAVLFVILSSAFVEYQKVNPAWIFALFYVLALDRFFTASMSENGAESCFNGALLYSIGTLFYGKGLLFAPVLWFIMIGLRTFNLRTFLASIIGLGLPYLILFFVPIEISQQRDLYDLIVYNMFLNVSMKSFPIHLYIYFGFIGLVMLLSLISIVGKYSSKKLSTRNFYKIFIISVLFLFGLSLTRLFSVELIPVAAIGASFMITHLLNNLKSPKVAGFIFYVLIVLTAVTQYFTHY